MTPGNLPPAASSAPEMEPEMVTIEIPRPIFEGAKEFIRSFGQALEAADASMKANKKGLDAQARMAESAMGLDGFGAELSAASNSGMGLPPMM